MESVGEKYWTCCFMKKYSRLYVRHLFGSRDPPCWTKKIEWHSGVMAKTKKKLQSAYSVSWVRVQTRKINTELHKLPFLVWVSPPAIRESIRRAWPKINIIFLCQILKIFTVKKWESLHCKALTIRLIV